MTADADLEARLREMDVDHVFVEFPDVNGLSRSKQLDAEYFLSSWGEGFSMNLALITQTPRSEVVEGSIYGDELDYADGTLVPDPDTLRPVPWRDDAARVIGDFRYGGEPVEGAPRTVLRRVLEETDDLGIDFTVGSELEFYLLDPTEDGYEPATSDKHECLTLATDEIAPFYDRVYEWAAGYDASINTLHHEYGAGQFEILFRYGEASPQADLAFRFKELVKRAARETDQHATFMAKPFTGRSGSGYHLHVGASDGEENAFAGDDDELSETGRHFIGGLLEHADALAALCTPNINGFKRYEPSSFAPYSASWGYGNRFAAARVPAHGTVRIENRIGSADANPYLVTAATLAAGAHGIREGIEPPEPSTGDPAGTRPRLPPTPRHALDALERDETLSAALGETIVDEYVLMKSQELEKFYDHTTEWERDEYIETL